MLLHSFPLAATGEMGGAGKRAGLVGTEIAGTSSERSRVWPLTAAKININTAEKASYCSCVHNLKIDAHVRQMVT